MADALDILTLAEGKAALRQGTVTANDTDIELLITAASTIIDRGVGPVVQRTITAEAHDGLDRVTGRRPSMVQLEWWPVTSITTVVEDGATLPADAYHADLDRGQVWRRLSDADYPWEDGRGNLVFTYIAGRFANTAAVTPFFKGGARLLLRHLWRSEQWNTAGLGPQEFDVPQVAFPTYAVPKAVADWFGPQWRTSRGRGGFV